MPQVMKLKAMLIPNKAGGGIMDSLPRSVQICQGLANLTNRTNLATAAS